MRLYLQECIRRDPSLVVEVLVEAEPYLRSIPTEYFLVLPHALRAAYGMALRGDMAGCGRPCCWTGRTCWAVGSSGTTGTSTSLAVSRSEPAASTAHRSRVRLPRHPRTCSSRPTACPCSRRRSATFHLHPEVTGSSTRTGALHLTGTTTDTLGKLAGRRDGGSSAGGSAGAARVRPWGLAGHHHTGTRADSSTGTPASRRAPAWRGGSTRARWETVGRHPDWRPFPIRSPLLWPVGTLAPRQGRRVALRTRLAVGATASIGPDPAGAGVREVRSRRRALRRRVPGGPSVRDRRARSPRAGSRHRRGCPARRGLRGAAPLSARHPRLVVFEAHLGTIYGDSPKYVYEAMRRQPPRDVARLGPARRATSAAPGRHGRAARHQRLPARSGPARYWVDNQTFPGYVRKRPGQRYLQTWHGIPLKRMGRDTARQLPEQKPPDRGIGAWDDAGRAERRTSSRPSCRRSTTAGAWCATAPRATTRSSTARLTTSRGAGGCSTCRPTRASSSTHRPSANSDRRRTGFELPFDLVDLLAALDGLGRTPTCCCGRTT